MEFFCGTGFTRPVRLCEETRRFAYESLHGKYGDDAKTTPHVSVDNIYGFDDMLDYERYTCCIDAIVRECPLRFVEGERIIGAATLMWCRPSGTARMRSARSAMSRSALTGYSKSGFRGSCRN